MSHQGNKETRKAVQRKCYNKTLCNWHMRTFASVSMLFLCTRNQRFSSGGELWSSRNQTVYGMPGKEVEGEIPGTAQASHSTMFDQISPAQNTDLKHSGEVA